MRLSSFTYAVFLLLFAVFFSGCLKDNFSPPLEVPLSDSGKLLFYLEDEGDYINSLNMPSLVSADEVFSHSDLWPLIDIRPVSEFQSGHIEGAHNVSHSNLIAFLDSINYLQYPSIVIISKNGQSSAYYTSLLRLYGFGNVYSMNYGMASWNSVFADQWFNALQQNYELIRDYYTDNIAFKPPLTPLPGITLSGSSLEEGVKNRIKQMMDEDYEDNLGALESTATIDYNILMGNPENFFIVCYHTGVLYKDIRYGIAHPQNTVLYHPPPSASELKSTSFLQTLPSDMKIAFYSTNGQLSAFAVAYLRLLGYDAKSVLFGANNMFYYTLAAASGFDAEVFSANKIRNYPYVTGN